MIYKKETMNVRFGSIVVIHENLPFANTDGRTKLLKQSNNNQLRWGIIGGIP